MVERNLNILKSSAHKKFLESMEHFNDVHKQVTDNTNSLTMVKTFVPAAQEADTAKIEIQKTVIVTPEDNISLVTTETINVSGNNTDSQKQISTDIFPVITSANQEVSVQTETKASPVISPIESSLTNLADLLKSIKNIDLSNLINLIESIKTSISEIQKSIEAHHEIEPAETAINETVMGSGEEIKDSNVNATEDVVSNHNIIDNSSAINTVPDRLDASLISSPILAGASASSNIITPIVSAPILTPTVNNVISAGVTVKLPEYDGVIDDTPNMPAPVTYGASNSRPPVVAAYEWLIKSVVEQTLFEDALYSKTARITTGIQDNDTITYVDDFRDDIIGGNGNDTISSGNKNDFVLGGKGQDIIDGGTGDDMIAGGDGIDTLTGGSGNDLFYFDSANYNQYGDIIKDFDYKNSAAGDRIIFVVDEDLAAEYRDGLFFDFDKDANVTNLIYKDALDVDHLVATLKDVNLTLDADIINHAVILQQYDPQDLSAIV